MTQPKRYQGEALRAEQWHNMGRDKAWEKKRAGIREIEPIVRGKFNIYAETKYDALDCGYLITVELHHAKPPHPTGIMGFPPGEPIVRFEEPALEFPSEHLKTKLILMAG